jgi:anaerobic selenocysteine-containing dehydrogenase
MKIDRRSFLSLAAGVAAGTALTPLPLKLTDDLSIWTQSFRYLPNEVPVPPDGAVSIETSVCTLCPGGCGISVRKIENRAVKIEGRQGYPVNDGGLCALGLAGLQLLYGPWRVQTPLKKKDGGFKKISWEQALKEIGDRLNEMRNNGKPHTVAGIATTGHNTTGKLLGRFLTVFGSPHFFTVPAVEDSLALAAGSMMGASGVPAFDFENSTYILSFGSGLLDGWGAPVRMFRAHSRWQEDGATLVQVEARLSNTAAKAHAWVPVNPGTEAALALGLAHIIVRDGLHAPGL